MTRVAFAVALVLALSGCAEAELVDAAIKKERLLRRATVPAPGADPELVARNWDQLETLTLKLGGR